MNFLDIKLRFNVTNMNFTSRTMFYTVFNIKLRSVKSKNTSLNPELDVKSKNKTQQMICPNDLLPSYLVSHLFWLIALRDACYDKAAFVLVVFWVVFFFFLIVIILCQILVTPATTQFRILVTPNVQKWGMMPFVDNGSGCRSRAAARKVVKMSFFLSKLKSIFFFWEKSQKSYSAWSSAFYKNVKCQK